MVESQGNRSADLKIRVEDLDFYYGNVQALFGIVMDIHARQVTSLIGPSGCGKSTLLRALNRMNDVIEAARTEGRVFIDGEDIYRNGVDVVKLRKKVGMVFQ